MTFVAHRISYIQQVISSSQWRHVSSPENPADLLSRRTTSDNLIGSTLWWQGLPWLKLPPASWPKSSFTPPKTLPEIKVAVLRVAYNPPDRTLWKRFSSFEKLVRVMSWVWRFKRNVIAPSDDRNLHSTLSTEETSALGSGYSDSLSEKIIQRSSTTFLQTEDFPLITRCPSTTSLSTRINCFLSVEELEIRSSPPNFAHSFHSFSNLH